MSKDTSNKQKRKIHVFKVIDLRQPEVKCALCISLLLAAFYISVDLHSGFPLYEKTISDILQCLVSGVVGLIGVAIAGVAIVIALFSSSQIKTIEELSPGAFEEILYDFKWFALLSALETALFILTILVIHTPLPIAPAFVFYLFAFLLTYSVFYLLFYGYALIGNCIKLSHIKNSLEKISILKKDVPTSAIELELEFLVSKLLAENRVAADDFYKELMSKIETSTLDGKAEMLDYLNNRYNTQKNAAGD